AYITGSTDCTDLPVTAGAYQMAAKGNGEDFVAKLNATGTTLVYSTYLGGATSKEREVSPLIQRETLTSRVKPHHWIFLPLRVHSRPSSRLRAAPPLRSLPNSVPMAAPSCTRPISEVRSSPRIRTSQPEAIGSQWMFPATPTSWAQPTQPHS